MVNSIVQKHNLSALIFWRPDELVLMLGYMPLWGLSFLVYTADDAPVLFVPESEPEDILPQDITIQKFPWGNITRNDPWEILYREINTMLKTRHLSNKPVSFTKSMGGTAPCRMSGEQPPLPVDLLQRLSHLSISGFKDTSADLILLYQFKTEKDVQGIKLAHEIARIAVRNFYDEVKPGITEAKLAAIVEGSVQEMIGQMNVSFSKAWAMIQSGINTIDGGRYNRSTGKKIQVGELIMMEMSVCVNGYWADITRTAATEILSEKHGKIIETVKQAQNKALEIAKPGIQMGKLYDVARKYISDSGFAGCFNHPLGHQVGFRYHDPGPGLSPGCNAILQEGMVLTVEPGIYGIKPGAGARIEDNILITANGYELLSDYP